MRSRFPFVRGFLLILMSHSLLLSFVLAQETETLSDDIVSLTSKDASIPQSLEPLEQSVIVSENVETTQT
jgi:hypothetical protein